MKSATRIAFAFVCTTPSIAVAPNHCYVNNSTCGGTCGSSSNPVRWCQQPPLIANPGAFTIREWQLVTRWCVSYGTSVAYDCDEMLDPGWVPTGCNPGGGVCCKGHLDSAVHTFGALIWMPKIVNGCLQPG